MGSMVDLKQKLNPIHQAGIEVRKTAERLGGLKSNPDPIKLGSNDQYDAFRHAYTSALVAQFFDNRAVQAVIYGEDYYTALSIYGDRIGTLISKDLGDLNERPYDPKGEHKGTTLEQYKAVKNMDLYSNGYGREEYLDWKKS